MLGIKVNFRYVYMTFYYCTYVIFLLVLGLNLFLSVMGMFNYNLGDAVA